MKSMARTGPSLFVIPTGFEPVADRLEICCSIQLSYGTPSFFGAKVIFRTVVSKSVAIFARYNPFPSPAMEQLLRLEPVIDTVYRIRSRRPVRRIPESADEAVLQAMLAGNPAHFAAREALADRLVAAGRIGEACQLRLEGCRLVFDLLDGVADETVALDWEDAGTAQALTMVYDSAADHFVIGDFELAAAMLEMLTDCDPEDHLNGAELLVFCYGALEEWELFDETLQRLPPEALSTRLAVCWGDFRRSAELSPAVRERMRTAEPQLFREWTATQHELPSDRESDGESGHEAAAAEARRLWLRTESLWRVFPEFAEYLKG